jgi:hypothetical protein
MYDDKDGIYFINPKLTTEQLRKEAEGLLMSVVVCIDILQQEYSTQLTNQPQCFLKTLHNCAQQLFELYCVAFPLQSLDATTYAEQERAFILNPALSKTKQHDYLRGISNHLVALCEEGLQTALLDHLNDRGGNILMNAALQAQTLRQLVEIMQLKMHESPQGIA